MVLWDRKLHMAIAKATNNQQMINMLDKVFEKMVRIALPISPDRLMDSVRQHEAILDAIRQRNAEEARRMMMDHDRDVIASVKSYQYQNIHLFK
jgi:DNA-binding GntR family transcriptional regulator